MKHHVEIWFRGSWRCESIHATHDEADEVATKLAMRDGVRTRVFSVPDWHAEHADGSESEVERARR